MPISESLKDSISIVVRDISDGIDKLAKEEAESKVTELANAIKYACGQKLPCELDRHMRSFVDFFNEPQTLRVQDGQVTFGDIRLHIVDIFNEDIEKAKTEHGLDPVALSWGFEELKVLVGRRDDHEEVVPCELVKPQRVLSVSDLEELVEDERSDGASPPASDDDYSVADLGGRESAPTVFPVSGRRSRMFSPSWSAGPSSNSVGDGETGRMRTLSRLSEGRRTPYLRPDTRGESGAHSR